MAKYSSGNLYRFPRLLLCTDLLSLRPWSTNSSTPQKPQTDFYFLQSVRSLVSIWAPFPWVTFYKVSPCKNLEWKLNISFTFIFSHRPFPGTAYYPVSEYSSLIYLTQFYSVYGGKSDTDYSIMVEIRNMPMTS